LKGVSQMTEAATGPSTRLGETIAEFIAEFYSNPPAKIRVLQELYRDPSKANRQVLEAWLLNNTPWIRNFPRWLGLVYGNCPETKVRQFLLDDMVDEDMIDKRAGDSHPGLHRRVWKALGNDLNVLDEYEKAPLPEISLVINSEYDAARHWPWLEGLICVGISEMTTVNPNSFDKRFKKETGMTTMMSSLMQQFVSYEDAAFAWVHESADIGHAGGHLRVIEEFTPRSQEDKVLQAARTGLKWRRLLDDVLGREMEKAL
jgi:pyrroloquinoline quinone (PQQ) biosynthesis protein C